MYYLIFNYAGEETKWSYRVFGTESGDVRVQKDNTDTHRIQFDRKYPDGGWHTMYTQPGYVIQVFDHLDDAVAECDRLNSIYKVMAS